MAKQVFINPQIMVNSVDLTDHIDSVGIEETAADVDSTGFGSTAKRHLSGLQDNKLTIEFQQDFGAAEVDATLNGLFGQSVPVVIKPLNAATSTVNPAYTMNAVIEQYKPVEGKVGDLLKMSLTWPIDGVVTRATV